MTAGSVRPTPWTIMLLEFYMVGAALVVAQTTAGQFTGRVTDPSGAVVPGARIVATNVATGVKRETVSNDEGNYAIPLLDPGEYTLRVSKEGFGTIERAGVRLHVNQTARVDFVMPLGTVAEKVFVTADLPLLQVGDSALRTVIDNVKITDLPLKGRNPFDLVYLAPGAQPHAQPSLPGNTIPQSNFSINGGPAMTNEVLLDGVPNTTGQFNAYTVIPSIDAVEEFEVKTNAMSAEFGRTGGGVINVSMKSGSNEFHGVVYDFLRNDALDSNTWLNNKSGLKNPPLRYNQFGATLGGRFVRDRTFFFMNYEGLRQRTGRTIQFTVPTLEQREGDFSQTLAQNGRLVVIYDPLTVRSVGSRFERSPFPGNLIPKERFNEVSKNILPYWGKPTHPGTPPTRANNFIKNSVEKYDVNQFNVRIDHNFTSANRLFGRFSWDENWVIPPVVFDKTSNPASGPQLFTHRNFALNDTHTFSPATFATFRVGFTRLRDFNEPADTNFDMTKLGFPAYFRDIHARRVFPSVTVNGYVASNIGFGSSSIGPVNSTVINNISNGYTAQADATQVRGKHLLKAGLDARLYRGHGFRPFLPSFTFGTAWTQGPNPQEASVNAGNSFASFLLGLAASGQVQILPTQDVQTYYYAGYLQDDWKVSGRLTLNLGLRFEAQNLRTDRYNRLNVLDLGSPSPLRVPGLSTLRGGLVFVGVDGRPREQARVAHCWGPRVGLAYAWRSRTITRAGYGIFYAPRTGWDYNQFGQIGFSATTPHVASPDGIHPQTYWSDPYPHGFIQPTGSSLGMLTNVGGSISAPDYDQYVPYVQQWNFNIQRQLLQDLAVELAYVGVKGTRLWQNLEWNQLPDQYLSLREQLRQVIDNPFYGIISAAQSLGTPKITYGQLLRPYPHFTSVTTIGSTSGSSIYHAFELRVEKRLSKGVHLLASYTIPKQIDEGARAGRIAWLGNEPTFQNNNNRRAERSVSSHLPSQRFTLAAGWELPIGRGKALGGGLPVWADKLAGGWQLNWISTWQTGRPLALTCAVNNTNSYGGGCRPNSTGRSAKLSGPVRERLDRYFDTSAFTLPPPFTFGNVSRTLPDVRGPNHATADLSLVKNVRFAERFRLQFRAEAFNAFNNVNFWDPGTSVGGANYGVITGAGGARIVQLALKLHY